MFVIPFLVSAGTVVVGTLVHELARLGVSVREKKKAEDNANDKDAQHTFERICAHQLGAAPAAAT